MPPLESPTGHRLRSTFEGFLGRPKESSCSEDYTPQLNDLKPDVRDEVVQKPRYVSAMRARHCHTQFEGIPATMPLLLWTVLSRPLTENTKKLFIWTQPSPKRVHSNLLNLLFGLTISCPRIPPITLYSDCNIVIMPDAMTHRPRLSVRGENYVFGNPEKYAQDMEFLLTEGKFCDTRFLLGQKGYTLHGHKAIIAARCPVISKMLLPNTGDLMQSTTSSHVLKGCEPEVFRILIRFLYTNRMNFENMPTGKVGLTSDIEKNIFTSFTKYSEPHSNFSCRNWLNKSITDDVLLSSLKCIFDAIIIKLNLPLPANCGTHKFGRELKITVYEKLTDTGAVLNYSSAHPKSLFASVASSIFGRVRALCTEGADRTAAQTEVQNKLLRMGHPTSLIRRYL
ncbi:hypothetical protein CLF_106910 [Clonorchis sinensis]|uniref:BTB domain-containing protein n=1 Tax=Clonorchis sinensis TaxID=79923 RepID=G7YFX3_CLOSI|nr:hypothetical protein CLF_106910 [Clonorchis sinensis]